MATELVAEGEISDYGSTQKKEELLVGIPGAMMDRNRHHHTSTSNTLPGRPLWKTKKFVVLGIIGMMMLAGVVVATLLRDFSAGPARTGQSILGRSRSYPRVTIVNDTPYDVRPFSCQNPCLEYTPHVRYHLDFRSPNPLDHGAHTLHTIFGQKKISAGDLCWSDRFDDPGIKAGQRWVASSSRGMCLVNEVVAVLTLPDGRGDLQCTNYEYEQDDFKTGVNTGTEETTGGTAKSIFYIRMGGGDGCCVLGSWQSPRCSPKQTYVHNPDYSYDGGENDAIYDSEHNIYDTGKNEP